MIELHNGLLLYHGSYIEVCEPKLELCAKYKDFGQGFYLTTSKAQAESFARLSTAKAIANGIVPANQKNGVVSAFRADNIASITSIIYQSADSDWLHCIVGHRKKHTFDELVAELSLFDVIGGKIADDSTNATINAYMAGTFGVVGSERADAICIELLIPERLKDQFCFRTESAIKCLEFIGSERIWMKE